MGMLMHNTLMEQETAQSAKKPVEVPAKTKPEAEPEKKPASRRKTSK